MTAPRCVAIRSPEQFLTHLNGVVMRPGLYPYPQNIKKKHVKQSIIFGPMPRAFRSLGPLIALGGMRRKVLKDEGAGKIRANIEGADLVEDIPSSGPFPDHSFLGSLEAIEGILERTPEQLLASANLIGTRVGFFRDGFERRMADFGKSSIRGISNRERAGRAPSPRELHDLAVDFALAGELRAGHPTDAGEFFFLSGFLFSALSHEVSRLSKPDSSEEMALQMFIRSMRSFPSWPAAAIGEIALRHVNSADEGREVAKQVAEGWLQATRRFMSVDGVHDICLLRGLVIAVETGAWEETDKLFLEKARWATSVRHKELDHVRALWAYAMGRPWEMDSKKAWDEIASRINEVLGPYETWIPAHFKGVPPKLAGLRTLLTAATDFRLGRGYIQ